MANLATRAQVLQVAYGQSTGLDVSGSDIDDAIVDAQNSVFNRYGDSVHAKFNLISSRTQYEFVKDRIETHEIKFVFISNQFVVPDSDINRNILVSASYTADLNSNQLTFTTDQVSGWNASICEVNYIPKSWHLLTKNKAALQLLDGIAVQINPGEGRTENPRVTQIRRRIEEIESDMAPMVAVGSFENQDYDVRDRDLTTQRRFNRNS